MSKWTDEEIMILKNNCTVANNDIIKLLPNKTITAITHKKSRLHIRSYCHWTPEKISLLKMVYPTYSKDQLLLIFNESWSKITQIACRYKIKQEKTYDVSKLLSGDNISYYWMGFLIADGYFISKNNRFSMGIELADKDLQHLTQFGKYLGDVNIYSRSRNTNSSISVYDKKIKNIMEKFDIKPNKTYNPPNLNIIQGTPDNIFSLIIGIIDGDGMIRKVGNNSSQITIEWQESWINNLMFIEEFLYNHFEMKKLKQYSHIKNVGRADRNTSAILSLCRGELNHKIKTHATKLNIPKLERKWDKIPQIQTSALLHP